jgi:primosomal protein N' (replication factor Y)
MLELHRTIVKGENVHYLEFSDGKTIIQTYWPESSAISSAGKHDFDGFYKKELIERQKYNYPPFSHLVRVISEHSSQQTAKDKITEIALKFKKAKIEYIGPGPCFYHKLNNRYRFQIIVKLQKLPDKALTEIYRHYPRLTFDVDPTDLL